MTNSIEHTEVIPDDHVVVVFHGQDDAIVYVLDEDGRDVLLSHEWGQQIAGRGFCPVVDHAKGVVTIEFGEHVVGRSVTVGVVA